MRKVYYLPNLSKMPLSAIFEALSDPVRLGIVRSLLKEDECSCGEFDTHVSKSTLSHHFKVLYQAGLIQKRDVGTRQLISLRREQLEKRCPRLLELIATSRRPW